MKTLSTEVDTDVAMPPFMFCPCGSMLPCFRPCIFTTLVRLVTSLSFAADVFFILVPVYNMSIRFEFAFFFLSRNFLYVLFELGLEVQSC